MNYVDAHCHLISDDAIKSALRCGVDGFICCAVGPHDWGRVADIAGANACVWPAFGVHPWYIDNLPDSWDVRLREILAMNPKYMVGEIGLDKNRPDMPTQINVFKTQMEIAAKMGRAAHIHCVGAWDRMMGVLGAVWNGGPFVLHSYAGSADLTVPLARMGAYFSFSHAVMDTRRAKMRAAAASAPANRIVVESDAPDSGFAPGDIGQIALEIAKIRNTEPADMAQTLYNNAQRILKDG